MTERDVPSGWQGRADVGCVESSERTEIERSSTIMVRSEDSTAPYRFANFKLASAVQIHLTGDIRADQFLTLPKL